MKDQPYYAVITLIEGIAMKTNFRKPLTSGVHGMLLQPPKVGERFFMYLQNSTERYLRTSVVQQVREDGNGTVDIRTKHSIYVLSEISEATP